MMYQCQLIINFSVGNQLIIVMKKNLTLEVVQIIRTHFLTENLNFTSTMKENAPSPKKK